MQSQLKQIQEKLARLSPENSAEVEDFIDFLQQREQDERLRQDYAQASEEVFGKVRDNDADAVHDRL